MVYMSRRSRFQSTPPVWAETHGHKGNAKKHNNFNPLRPCGRRPSPCRVHAVPNRISIHSARVGGDHLWMRQVANLLIISIHSARVGGDAAVGVVHNFTAPISIHSARVGGDIAAQILFAPHLDFNPLRPCGRRQQKKPFFRLLSISITTYFTEKSKRTRCKFSHLGYLFQYSLLILVRTSLYVDV